MLIDIGDKAHADVRATLYMVKDDIDAALVEIADLEKSLGHELIDDSFVGYIKRALVEAQKAVRT